MLVLIPLPFSLSPFPPPPQYMPLRAWLYRDGFARFSNTRFTLNSIDDQCILASHPPPLSVLHIPCSACPLAGPEITHSFHRCLLSARLWSGQGDTAVNKIALVTSLPELTILWRWGILQ